MLNKIFSAIKIFLLLSALAFADTQLNNKECQILSCASPFEENLQSQSKCFTIDQKNNIVANRCIGCSILFENILSQKGEWKSKELKNYDTCLYDSLQNNVIIKKKYSGEKCEENSNCFSNVCNNLVCRGKQSGENCSDIQEEFCDVGLSCVLEKCMQSKKLKESCEYNSECDSNLFCHNKICRTIGNLKEGDYSSKTGVETIDIYCKSFLKDNNGRCINSPNSFEIKECTKEMELSGTLPSDLQCQKNKQCALFDNEETQYYLTNGINTAIKKFIKTIKEKILLQNQLCPKSFKLSEKCHLISSEIQQYLEIQTIYPVASKLVDIPSCLKEKLKHKELLSLFFSRDQIIEDQEDQDGEEDYEEVKVDEDYEEDKEQQLEQERIEQRRKEEEEEAKKLEKLKEQQKKEEKEKKEKEEQEKEKEQQREKQLKEKQEQEKQVKEQQELRQSKDGEESNEQTVVYIIGSLVIIVFLFFIVQQIRKCYLKQQTDETNVSYEPQDDSKEFDQQLSSRQGQAQTQGKQQNRQNADAESNIQSSEQINDPNEKSQNSHDEQEKQISKSNPKQSKGRVARVSRSKNSSKSLKDKKPSSKEQQQKENDKLSESIDKDDEQDQPL